MHNQSFRTGQPLSHKKGRLHRYRVVLPVRGCSQIGSPLSFNRGNRHIPLRVLLLPYYPRNHRGRLQTHRTISKTYNPLWLLQSRHTSQVSTLYLRFLMGRMDTLCIRNKGQIARTSRRSSRRLKDRSFSLQTPHLLPRNDQRTGRPSHLSIQIRRRSPVDSHANHINILTHHLCQYNQTNPLGHNLYRANHRIRGNRRKCDRWHRWGLQMAVYHLA